MKITHTIPWLNYGIDFESNDALYLPVALIQFLYEKDLSDIDKLSILRIYSLLQTSEDTEEITRLVKKIENKEYLDEDNEDTILYPLYKELYPSLKGSKTGYILFIEGETRSLPFPEKILDILKAMELNDKDLNPKNKTSRFLLNFIFELVNDNGETFLSDEFYVGNKKLAGNKNNLLFAIAKTCYEVEHNINKRNISFLTNVKIIDGLVINEIISESTLREKMQEGISMIGEENISDNLTRLFFRYKYGEDVVENITTSTLNQWRFYWNSISQESKIPISELEPAIISLFSKVDPSLIPMPWVKSIKNPAYNLSVMLKQTKTKIKGRVTSHVLDITGDVE